jgi:hypothetical protein
MYTDLHHRSCSTQPSTIMTENSVACQYSIECKLDNVLSHSKYDSRRFLRKKKQRYCLKGFFVCSNVYTIFLKLQRNSIKYNPRSVTNTLLQLLCIKLLQILNRPGKNANREKSKKKKIHLFTVRPAISFWIRSKFESYPVYTSKSIYYTSSLCELVNFHRCISIQQLYVHGPYINNCFNFLNSAKN